MPFGRRGIAVDVDRLREKFWPAFAFEVMLCVGACFPREDGTRWSRDGAGDRSARCDLLPPVVNVPIMGDEARLGESAVPPLHKLVSPSEVWEAYAAYLFLPLIGIALPRGFFRLSRAGERPLALEP